MKLVRNDALIPQIQALYTKYKGEINPEFNHGGIDDDSHPLDDTFNDYRWYWLPNKNEFYLMIATTGPGADCIKSKPGGAAKLCYGFWKNAHVIDIHAKGTNFAHEAFCQRPAYHCQPVTIHRLNRQGLIDNSIQVQTSNDFGINIHRASIQSDLSHIGPYSEGCQVADHHQDHEQEIAAAKLTSMYKQNFKCLWSYLLFPITEINLKV
jgi:hypothetical protein